MFITVQEYLKRITLSLENVVAPELDSDHARGQLLAAIFLLDQLLDRVDYKPDVLKQDIQADCNLFKKIAGACGEGRGQMTDEMKSFAEELEKGDLAVNLKNRNRCEAMLSRAIEMFFSCRDKLEPGAAFEINGALMKHFVKTGARDLGMLKLSVSDKLIQRKS